MKYFNQYGQEQEYVEHVVVVSKNEKPPVRFHPLVIVHVVVNIVKKVEKKHIFHSATILSIVFACIYLSKYPEFSTGELSVTLLAHLYGLFGGLRGKKSE